MIFVNSFGIHSLLVFPIVALPGYVLWLIGSCVLTAIGAIIATKCHTAFKGKSIAILGPQGCGKTSFLRFLQAKPYDEKKDNGTGVEDYDSFKTKIGGGKEYIIKSGKDIGGGRDFIPFYYERMINDTDIVVFMFDINEYFNNTEYQEDVIDRMDFVWRKLQHKYKDDDIKSKYAVIGTHYDLLPEEESKKALEKLCGSVSREDFTKMLNNNTFLVNLIDHRKDVSECLKNLFK